MTISDSVPSTAVKAVVEEGGFPPTTPTAFPVEVRLREAIRELEQLGLRRVEECVRLGAAVMVERCIAEYRSRPGVGVGWLAAAVRDGGSWFADEPPRPRSVTDLLLGGA